MTQLDPLGLANLTRPDVLADPYPFYRRLRSEDPVHWDGQMWLLSRYADVQAVLRDSRFSSRMAAPGSGGSSAAPPAEPDPFSQTLQGMMAGMDPPAHTRLRSLVNRAFTAHVLHAIRPRVQELVDSLLDAVQPHGSMDVIRDLADPMSLRVIGQMLGCPADDVPRLRGWSEDLVLLLLSMNPDPASRMKAVQGGREMTAYFSQLVQDRRKNPGTELIDALIAAQEQGDRLSEEELLANCVLILFAGHGTMTNLIGNAVLALLRNPEQLQQLRENPSLMESAIEEFMRFDTPAPAVVRSARENLEIAGRTISRGQPILVLLGAANHDPAQFSHPDELCITRTDNRHIAFGVGIHFCLGAQLARLEAQIAIGTLLRRMTTLRLAAEAPTWRPTPLLRGLQSLPVLF